MEITYTDSNEVSLNNAVPGDSVTKTFKVKNDGSLSTIYNIKLNITKNTFVDKDDIKVTLKKKTGAEAPIEKSHSIPSESGYILVNQTFDSQ